MKNIGTLNLTALSKIFPICHVNNGNSLNLYNIGAETCRQIIEIVAIALKLSIQYSFFCIIF